MKLGLVDWFQAENERRRLESAARRGCLRAAVWHSAVRRDPAARIVALTDIALDR